jgi:four helix bundle protein
VNPKTIALQDRTHRFFVRVTQFCEALPKNSTTSSVIDQLTDSAGSTDSNYRAACRARSTAEFISKIGVAAEEADESKGWLTALLARAYGDAAETHILIREADELTAIFTASHKTASKHRAERRLHEAEHRRRMKRRPPR